MAVSVDGRLAGVVAVADRVRSGAAQMVAELHAAEVKKVVMLTGDARRAAEAVAVMRQNIVIALGTVGALLAGVLLGGVTMALGMLVHEVSVLVVIGNAMRLLRRASAPRSGAGSGDREQGLGREEDRHEGDHGHQDDGDGDQHQDVAAPLRGEGPGRGGGAARQIDHRAHAQGEHSHHRSRPEDDPADRHERQGGAEPGQRGAFTGQPGVDVLHVVPGQPSTPDSTTRTAAIPATAAMTIARTRGRGDRGIGSLRRSARWLRSHSKKLPMDRKEPNAMSDTASRWRPHGSPENGGSSCTMATPPMTMASAVRFQARNVRSLAKVNRASGSVSSGSMSCGSSGPVSPPPPADPPALMRRPGRSAAARRPRTGSRGSPRWTPACWTSAPPRGTGGSTSDGTGRTRRA